MNIRRKPVTAGSERTRNIAPRGWLREVIECPSSADRPRRRSRCPQSAASSSFGPFRGDIRFQVIEFFFPSGIYPITQSPKAWFALPGRDRHTKRTRIDYPIKPALILSSIPNAEERDSISPVRKISPESRGCILLGKWYGNSMASPMRPSMGFSMILSNEERFKPPLS